MQFIKRLFVSVFLLSVAAIAQVTYIVPQGNQASIFSAVSSAGTSGCLVNQGQNVWISTYSNSVTAGLVDYRLEGSFNSDAATCTTGNWFAISDDATDLTSGTVIGIGSFPYVRANLVAYASGGTFSSSYNATSAAPGFFYGNYNPTQSIRKVVFSNANDGVSANVTIPVPYGSTGGIVIAQNLSHNWSGTATVGIVSFMGKENITAANSFILPTTLPNASFQVPNSMASSIRVNYFPGTTTGGTFSLYYIFFPPGYPPASAQPAGSNNSEVTSGLNAAVNVTLTPPAQALTGPGFSDVIAAVYVYSVSARCSAGTAQLKITDTTSSTQLWSTAAGEVGTTTFRYQWVPGLNASTGLGDIVQVQLTACGAGNTGTLDVQASIF